MLTEKYHSNNLFFQGLSTLKATLKACAHLKLLNASENHNEIELVANALIDVNLSKLINDDIPIFEGILQDIFGHFTAESGRIDGHDSAVMKDTFDKLCNENNLQPIDGAYKKLLQMYELLKLRQGIILIGDPYSGKSIMIKLLASLLHRVVDNDIDVQSMNRKCKVGKRF